MPQSPEQPHEPNSLEKLEELSSVLQGLADQQLREHEARLIEASLEEKRIANAHAYALEYLKADREDRDSQRTVDKRNTTYGFWCVVIVIFLLFSFFSLALWKGKDQIVMEVVKTVLALITGGIGGYGIGRNKVGKSDGKAE